MTVTPQEIAEAVGQFQKELDVAAKDPEVAALLGAPMRWHAGPTGRGG